MSKWSMSPLEQISKRGENQVFRCATCGTVLTTHNPHSSMTHRGLRYCFTHQRHSGFERMEIPLDGTGHGPAIRFGRS